MAKKRGKRAIRNKKERWLIPKKQVNRWLDQANDQLMEGHYENVLKTCHRVLRYAPPQTPERGDALEHMGTAYTMLKQFEDAYQALSEALKINPHHAYLWYNRGLVGRFTVRLVQAIYDLEKAVELEKAPQVHQKFAEVLAQTQELAEEERAIRGPDFTLEQLRKQQELFQQGLQYMQQEKWTETQQAFLQVIEMADYLPQPWGNLGIALLMQQKYDEAEAAFKRALEIDSDYDLAQRNLAALPNIRQTGHVGGFFLRNPAVDAKVHLDMSIVDEN